MTTKTKITIDFTPVKDILSKFGWVEGSMTSFEAYGSGKITGHCLMGAFGHAYEQGNSGLDAVTIISMNGQGAQITKNLIELGKVAKQHRDLLVYHGHFVSGKSDEEYIEQRTIHTGVTKEQAKLEIASSNIIDYNDSIAPLEFYIHEHHQHIVNMTTLPIDNREHCDVNCAIIQVAPETDDEGNSHGLYKVLDLIAETELANAS